MEIKNVNYGSIMRRGGGVRGENGPITAGAFPGKSHNLRAGPHLAKLCL